MSVWAEYETETQRLTLDISAQATQKFGFLFQDRIITPKGVASIIGILESAGAPPKLFVLYEGEPFVKAIDYATPEEMTKWSKLADSTEAASLSMANTREFHHLRQVNIFGQRRTIVMQSANGPCPIIAIANVLLLRGELLNIEKLAVGRQDAVATANQVQEAVWEYIVNRQNHHQNTQRKVLFNESARKDGTLALFTHSPAFEQLRAKLRDPTFGKSAMQRYYDGLFVEPIHDVVDGFASSEDAAVFTLCKCRLVHGWIMDFTSDEGADLQNLRTQSCSELQVAASFPPSEEPMAAVANNFLSSTQSQLTELGLNILSSELEEHEFVVMFRNNHFGVVAVDKGKLYTVVTDVVFTQRNDVVLQEVKVRDDGEFVDGACVELEPFIMRALEKFENRYTVDQIKKAVDNLMKQPNDLFLLAIQESIEGKPVSAKNQSAAAAAASGAAVAVGPSPQQPILQGQILNGTAVHQH